METRQTHFTSPQDRKLKEIKSLSGNEVVRALFKERVPHTVHSDKGTEFLGHRLQSLLKSHLIHHFGTQYEVNSNYAERGIKTITGKIYKYFTYKQSYCYIDALQDTFNSSVHHSIKMVPAHVTMRKLNSERKTREKTLLNLMLGTLSGSCMPERRFQGNKIRGAVVNCSKKSTDMDRKGIPHTKSKIMPGSPLMKHFMKRSFKRSLQ